MDKKVSTKNIKSKFKVSQSDVDEMSAKYEVETIAKNFQVLRVSINEWYHLNTDLVPDKN